MANLLHDDATAGKAGLLRAVALQGKTFRRVRDVVGSDWRVVRDLLDHQVCLSAAIVVGPGTVEESTPGQSVTLTLCSSVSHYALSENGVQRPGEV